MDNALFEIEDLAFSYPGRRVLDIPDLLIGKGSITAFTGPNGSGKSTLLMLLGHLFSPTEGRILFEGKDLSSGPASAMEAFRRRTGMVLQSPYLFRSTVDRNVSYPLRVRGTSKEKRKHLVESALSAVGLPGFGVRRCSELSGGEAQRAALARALVTKPDLLLLDEPMANVDTASQAVTQRVLLEICRDEGVTVIFTTHDLDGAYRVADEVVTILEGRVSAGAMENVFRGAVYQAGEDWIFDTGRITVAVPRGKDGLFTASIPPGSILVSRESGSSSARNSFSGKISGIQQRNGSVDIRVEVGESLTARITSQSYSRMGLKLGEEITLIFKAESVKIY